jgi:2,4-dienoyl-CoA reductase-like NADH-dependent reductase (Old Yellow Enzyme family)
MSRLFEQTSIGKLNVPNRFVRSATWEGLATDSGASTSRLNDLMAELARGGVGLIISSHAYVSPEGQAGPWQLGIYSDELLPGLREMADKVHEADGKIVAQLAHAGCRAATDLSGQPAIGPSEENGCRAMSRDAIHRVVDAFTQAAVRAKKAGLDGVQIHGAHGYLLSQFLSPHFNRREDEYGGSVPDRSRIVLEILERIKKEAGQDFPTLIKINSEDFLEGGLSQEDMLQICELLQEHGIDAIEMSGGTGDSGKWIPSRKTPIHSRQDEVYYRSAAKRYKERLRAPLILVGGIRSYEAASEVVEQGLADLVAFSRPLIREPGLVRRWESGDTAPSACENDNLCFKPILNGEGIDCYRLRQEAQ